MQRRLTFVNVDVLGVVEGEVEVLENLCKPERLHIVDLVRVDVVNIVEASIACVVAVCNLQVLVEALNNGLSSLVVLLVTGDTPRNEVGLEDFRAEDVIR